MYLWVAGVTVASAGLSPSSTVFVIVMENHNWSSIKAIPDGPYINNTLLPMVSSCEQYYNPPGAHPSEPNYLWLEAGTTFGILNDNPPLSNHQLAESRRSGARTRRTRKDGAALIPPRSLRS